MRTTRRLGVLIAVTEEMQGYCLAGVLLDRQERQAAASNTRCLVADTLLANGSVIGLPTPTGYAISLCRQDSKFVRLEKSFDVSATPLASLSRLDRNSSSAKQSNGERR
jgi:hypothetical protein